MCAAAQALQHPIVHASGEAAWSAMVEVGPYQGVLTRHGPQRTAAIGAAWLADSGLRPHPEGVAQDATARLWLLERLP